MQIKHITRTAVKATGVAAAALVVLAWIIGDPEKLQKEVIGRKMMN